MRSMVVAILFVGCSSSVDPAGSPNPPAQQPVEPGPTPVYPALEYPSGPYGFEAGQTVPDFEWSAILPGAPKATTSKFKLSNLYDPDGTRGINAILAVEQAEWCGPCRQEAQEFESKIRSKWGAEGVFLLDLLIEDLQKQNSEPLLLAAGDRWRTDFQLTDVLLALDPTFYFATATTSGIPVNVIIDPRTMTVVKRFEGSSSAVDTTVAALTSKNKL